MIAAQPAEDAARSKSSIRLVAVLAGGAILGKGLGFVRELLMARTLGATGTADSFRGSISAVLLPLGPILNESAPGIIIPMCRSWIEKGRGARELAELAIALGLTATVAMVLVQLAGSWWVKFIVGGFSAQTQSQVLEFIRIMALMMPAAVVLNCLAAADIAHGRSLIAALRASVVNVFVTLGIFAYILTGKLSFLPWSFALSFIALTLWALWLFVREGKISFHGVTARGVLDVFRVFMKKLRPLLAQPLVEQLHGWTERFVASGLMVGTMASLDYARTLTESAALILAQPIGMAVLHNGALPTDIRTVSMLSRVVIAVALPASIYLGIFAEDIVRLIFSRGAFDATAVELTSGSVRGIAPGLWAATLGIILVRLLNNAGRNGIAASVLAVGFLSNAATSVLVGHFVGPGGYGSQWLGFGESMRGFVMLTAVAVALGIVGTLAKTLALCLAPVALMAVGCIWIEAQTASIMLRLLAGGLVTAVTASGLAALLTPELAARGWRRLATVVSNTSSVWQQKPRS